MKSRKIVCTKLSSNFRECTAIVTHELPSSLEADQVLMETKYVGINASDINFTNGVYLPGRKPPFDCGFEAVGIVIDIGPKVRKLKKGDAVVSMSYGAFAEHIISKERHLIKVPAALPSILPMIVCGLTASIGLAKIGQMGHGETVLVTAAAGGTGQFAVQLAKLAGNHVIGTCSSKEKVQYLHSIGCDRAINYHEENLFQVLKKEYPKGIDLVFEGVGGEMFDICVNNLAIGGRVVVIGFISEYQENKGNKLKENKRLTPKLISKSASIRGFFLNHYLQREQVLLSSHLKKMSILVQKGLLNPGVDPFSFQGLESIPTAIEHMYQRKNKGKIVVQIKSISSRL